MFLSCYRSAVVKPEYEVVSKVRRDRDMTEKKRQGEEEEYDDFDDFPPSLVEIES